jgi:hypothetical protein
VPALQLRRYQQPEDFAEQLPRIERLLVWLHLAREVLEVAEDRASYGELNKLTDLAHQTIGPEVLAARKAQLLTISSLKAWRRSWSSGTTPRALKTPVELSTSAWRLQSLIGCVRAITRSLDALLRARSSIT